MIGTKENDPPLTPLASIQNIVEHIRYKPGWVLRFLIDFKRAGAPYLRWEFDSTCAKTDVPNTVFGRKWYLSEHMTKSEVVQTALMAALTAEEHECREFFRYKGKRIFGPHIDIYALMEVCNREDVRS